MEGFRTAPSIPKKAFALHPLSPTQIQQLLQPFGLSREGLNIVSSRLHTLYKGQIEYIQEALRNQWVYSLRTLSAEQLRRMQIPSLTDLPKAPATTVRLCIQTCNARSNSITHF